MRTETGEGWGVTWVLPFVPPCTVYKEVSNNATD